MMSTVPPPPKRGDAMLERSLELMQALNAAVSTIQQSVGLPELVFCAFGEQVSALGFRGGLGLLDSISKQLTLQAVAQSCLITKFLERIEQITRTKSAQSISSAKI